MAVGAYNRGKIRQVDNNLVNGRREGHSSGD